MIISKWHPLKQLQSKKNNIKETAKITQEVLGAIGLQEKEIELYLRCSGKGPVSIGEMALLVEISVNDTQLIANKFVEKGLFKEIMGATHYYQALPPYAAIVAQLDKFAGFISEIKTQTPQELNTSFQSFEEKAQGINNLKDFVGFLNSIKETVSDHISYQRASLDSNIEQLTNQQSVIESITALRDKSLGLVDQQLSSMTKQFEVLQRKINENLEKLHLGVIIKTVEDITQKVVSTEMETLKQSFQNNFAVSLKSVLDQLTQDIENTSTNATRIGSDLKDVFGKVLSQFDSTLTEAQSKITDISDSVLQSFVELRGTFSEKVIVTLDDVLGKISQKLLLSDATIKEFWEEAKRVINFTMKDVWFIRTPEGMRDSNFRYGFSSKNANFNRCAYIDRY